MIEMVKPISDLLNSGEITPSLIFAAVFVLFIIMIWSIREIFLWFSKINKVLSEIETLRKDLNAVRNDLSELIQQTANQKSETLSNSKISKSSDNPIFPINH